MARHQKKARKMGLKCSSPVFTSLRDEAETELPESVPAQFERGAEKRDEEEPRDEASRLAVRLLEPLDYLAEIGIVLDQLLDLLDRVHDRRVMFVVEQSS